jgi:hypothetical protein
MLFFEGYAMINIDDSCLYLPFPDTIYTYKYNNKIIKKFLHASNYRHLDQNDNYHTPSDVLGFELIVIPDNYTKKEYELCQYYNLPPI